MNRTSCVARLASWALVLVAATTSACSCAPQHLQRLDANVPLPDAFRPDVGRDGGHVHDGGSDVSVGGPCGTAGHAGAHCRDGTCASPLMCGDFSMLTTIQGAFGLHQGTSSDVAHAGYPGVEDPEDPMHSAPFNAFAGSLCVEQCDVSQMTDACGACASCSQTLTQMPLIATFFGVRTIFPPAMAMYGTNTGVCRLDCTWSATTRSPECPDDSMACDSFGSVCIEACTTDNECNTTAGYTYAGEIVTVLDTVHPRTCNAATGRCEFAGRVGAAVGDRCASGDDCAPGTGICLDGGLCGEFGCDASGTACGTNGICLDTTAATHPQTLCLRGCNTTSDCGPGNACNMLGGTTVGGFAGYCFDTCTDDSECAPDETCSDTTSTDTVTGAVTVVAGRCVPRCTSVGAIGMASGGCADTEFCLADHDGASYGRCAALDQFCGAPDTLALPASSTQCATGWVCDETLAGVAAQHDALADGHCAPACASDTDCLWPASCVTSGPLAGLCRVVCATDRACPTGQFCPDVGLPCIETAPLPPIM